MEKDKHKEMSRRDFFKIVGSAGLVISGLTGCNGKKSTDDKASKAQLGEMTSVSYTHLTLPTILLV